MKIALSNKHDAYYNLSLEETLLKDKNIKEDLLLIYINGNAIIAGRNQNIYEEVNEEYAKENHIQIVRRISGGGSVYHDKGNINFSFITQNKNGTYEKFLSPIIEFLNALGLNAKFHGKNDLEVNGFKVSGNAQYKYKDKMFHHGTLLFDSNLTVLSNVLRPNKLKLDSKSIKSIRQRVANIRTLLNEDMDPSLFVEKMLDFFITKKHATVFNIKGYKNDAVKELMKTRESREWIYGKNPEFNMENNLRFSGGTIGVRATIINNKIYHIWFYGDYLSSNDFEDIYKHLDHIEFDRQKIYEVLASLPNWDDYFGKITREEILTLLFG